MMMPQSIWRVLLVNTCLVPFLVYTFITHNLLPVDRNDKLVNDLTGYMIFKILTKVPLCLPYLIMRHMWAHKLDKKLPYGILLSVIFEHFEVPCDPNAVIAFNNWDLTLSQLYQMQIYLINGRFHHRSVFAQLTVDQQREVRQGMQYLNKIRKIPTVSGSGVSDEDSDADADADEEAGEDGGDEYHGAQIDIGTSHATGASDVRAPTTREMMTAVERVDGRVMALEERFNNFELNMNTRFTTMENNIYARLDDFFGRWANTPGGGGGGGGGAGSGGDMDES